MTKTRFKSLDGLRGLFALLVVCFHFSIDAKFDPLTATDNFLFRQSFVFVDFFFVLSGFVIAYNYTNQINSWKSFWEFIKKRFVRIYPLLFFSVLMYIPLKGYGIIVGFEFNDGIYTYKTLIYEMLDSLTFMNSTPFLGSTEGLNPPSWSISAEMISYALFGLLLIGFKRFAGSLTYFVLASLTMFFLMHGVFDLAGNFGFLRGLLGFFLGVLTFKVPLKENFSKYSLEIPYLLFLVAIIYFIDQSNAPLALMILPPWFAIGIWIFALEKGWISSLLGTRFIQYLGKISYSIYLNHFLVLWVMYFVVWILLSPEPSVFIVWCTFALTIILTVVYSHFTQRYIEIGLGDWLRRRMG